MVPERFGPYVIEGRLGSGGMGEVHRAVDTRKGRSVALKRLPAELTGDPSIEARFRREAEVAARLIEPHVIPIHDYGQIDGRLFLDMRLVEGVDLAKVSREGPVPPRRAVSIIGQIADALDAAHGDGLVHRDVKPSNILLTTPPRDSTAEDFVYLIDFGIAAGAMVGGRLTAPNSAVGTAAYMAPERFTSGDDDPRSDVYGLGCVLFEVLTGHLPFNEPGVAGLLWAHANAPVPTVSQSVPSLAAFDPVIAGALAKDPGRRFPRASDLAEAARRALEDLDVAPPAAPAARAPRTSPPDQGVSDRPADEVAQPERRDGDRLRSFVKIGLRVAGNVGALVANGVWLLVALGTLVAVDYTPLAIGGAVAAGAGITSGIIGLTTSGRRRSRYTLVAWILLFTSFVVVLAAIAGRP
jgi:serine/threonine protein kinase